MTVSSLNRCAKLAGGNKSQAVHPTVVSGRIDVAGHPGTQESVLSGRQGVEVGCRQLDLLKARRV